MSETSTPKKEPTASEAMFFYAIVKHTKNKADIDWSAVAVEQGFKNAEVAKVRFGQVKRKLGINGDTTPKKAGASSNASTPTKVTKTPPSRAGTKGGRGKGKVKKEEPDVGDEPAVSPKEEDGAETPSKAESDGETF